MIGSVSGQSYYANMIQNYKNRSAAVSSQGGFGEAVSVAQKQSTPLEASNGSKYSNRSTGNVDIKDLATRYNPTDMTQGEYERFLDELYANGIVNESELFELEHSQYVPSVQKVSEEDLRVGYISTLANGADLPPGGMVADFSMGAKRVNVLFWAQYEKSFKQYDTERGGWFQPTDKAAAFEKIYDILIMMTIYQ